MARSADSKELTQSQNIHTLGDGYQPPNEEYLTDIQAQQAAKEFQTVNNIVDGIGIMLLLGMWLFFWSKRQRNPTR